MKLRHFWKPIPGHQSLPARLRPPSLKTVYYRVAEWDGKPLRSYGVTLRALATVELVEAPPRARLAQPLEDVAQGGAGLLWARNVHLPRSSWTRRPGDPSTGKRRGGTARQQRWPEPSSSERGRAPLESNWSRGPDPWPSQSCLSPRGRRAPRPASASGPGSAWCELGSEAQKQNLTIF